MVRPGIRRPGENAMDEIAADIIGFVERHRDWAAWIMLGLAAAETTAFLSVVVPSTAIMVAVGALAATGAVDFTALWFGATIGALIGSCFSYWLGRRYGGVVLKIKPLRQHPEWVEKAQRAFVTWGPATVFGGHFVTFLRPVVFMMAGISGMGFGRFIIWNGVGCMAWAWVVPKFGEVGGWVLGYIWGLWGS